MACAGYDLWVPLDQVNEISVDEVRELDEESTPELRVAV